MTKIKDWFMKYLDLFLAGLALVIAFLIGNSIKLPGPVNKGEPRNFENIDHFKEWYFSRFLGFWYTPGDCDERAEYVRRCALQDGFVLSLALLNEGIYYGVKVSSTTVGHCAILALLENGEFWFLEHNDGKFCFIANKD